MIANAPSAARVLRATVAVLFVCLFLWETIFVDLLVFAGVVQAVFFSKAARLVSRRLRLPYPLSLALVILGLAIVVGAAGWFFAQSVIAQFHQLSLLLKGALTELHQRFPVEWNRLVGQGTAPFAGAFKSLLGVFSSFVTVIGAIVVILFLALYLAAEPALYERGIIRLVPPQRRDKAMSLLSTLADSLWFWMLGRLFSMIVIGVATTAGLAVLSIPVPIALGILAAILALAPYIGAIISAVPSLLLAFTIDPQRALYVLVLYVGIHILEGYILVPLVQRKATHIPPALALTGQLIMGVIAGLLGLLLAMPLMAVLIPTIKHLYVEDVLGDRAGGETRR